ncbi:MAG: hypothetical protein ACTHML_06000 [Ginsengibacter sp.]
MVLITYDLKTDHVRVKNALKAKGWKETVQGNNGITNLPNTSLWKEGNDAIAAREEVRTIVSEPNLERLIAVVFTGWAGIIGEAFVN